MVRVAFVHPDLGIGGAERLICDAAIALQNKGHTVKIFTSHYDHKHCFKETIDGTLIIESVADWLPRHTCGRFYAFWAYLRMIAVAFYVVCLSDFRADVFFCDQVSACIPVLRLERGAKIIFYCHFPDMLLTNRATLLKKVYRAPIDWLEEFTTGCADVILVNSEFTSQTFHRTFNSLVNHRPMVLYPSLNFDSFKQPVVAVRSDRFFPAHKKYIYLSINRYERKKNIGLSINALHRMKLDCTQEQWNKVHLVIAGGYDERVTENKKHYEELKELAETLFVKDNVTFVRSFTDNEKIFLLQNATCVLYTPANEHFGIVPIEAMYMKSPVVACSSGGPLETVKHKVTGYLCQPRDDSFAECMMSFLLDPQLKKKMGEAGRRRVIEEFSFIAFTNNLNKILEEVYRSPSNNTLPWQLYLSVLLCIVLFLLTRFL